MAGSRCRGVREGDVRFRSASVLLWHLHLLLLVGFMVVFPCVASDNDEKARRYVYSLEHQQQQQQQQHSFVLCGNYSSLFMYTLTVAVGTPPVIFDVSFDTGSTDLMIPASVCDSCVPGRNGALYNGSASSSHSPVSCPSSRFKCRQCSAENQCVTQIRYVGITEDAFVDGDKSVSIGDGTLQPSRSAFVSASFGAITNITMQDMFSLPFNPANPTWIAAAAEDDEFVYPAGVVGFAKQNLSPFNGPSLFDHLVSHSRIQDIFSFCLNSWSLNRAVGGGLTLGAAGTKYSSLPISYTPLVRPSTGYYEVNVANVLVNNVSLSLNPALYNEPHSILDSGTPTLTFNQEVFNYLVAFIRTLCATQNLVGGCGDLKDSIFNGQSCFAMNQSDIDSWPTISINLEGGVTLSYDPRQYLIPLWYCKRGTFGLAIQGDPTNFGTVIGATVLQAYATTIDRVSQRAGFAPVRSCPRPASCRM